MKILVLSDIHAHASYAERMIEKEQPDEVIFCGDGWKDMHEIAKFFPAVRFHCVAGNCDFFSENQELFITLGGKNIFAAHGHRFNVKMEPSLAYITLRAHALDLGADIILFGHTHRPDVQYRNGAVILNPGAVMDGKYALITIENGEVKPELRSL